MDEGRGRQGLSSVGLNVSLSGWDTLPSPRQRSGMKPSNTSLSVKHIQRSWHSRGKCNIDLPAQALVNPVLGHGTYLVLPWSLLHSQGCRERAMGWENIYTSTPRSYPSSSLMVLWLLPPPSTSCTQVPGHPRPCPGKQWSHHTCGDRLQ